LWVYDANEIKTSVILAASDSHIGVKGENLFEAFQVFIGYRFYTKPQGDTNKNRVFLKKLFFYFIKEDVAIITYDYFEISEWLRNLIYLLQCIEDGLRSVPLSWFFPKFLALHTDVMNAECCFLIV